jgi:hypothetical protein
MALAAGGFLSSLDVFEWTFAKSNDSWPAIYRRTLGMAEYTTTTWSGAEKALLAALCLSYCGDLSSM